MPSEEILKDFEQNVQRCAPMLKQLSAEIIKQEVSNYPIFIASDDAVNMGKIIFIKGENEMNYNIYVSHLEEFVNRDIINSAMTDLFKETYKNPDNFLCLFAIFGEEASFVFMPV
jgi:hypothetical protein